MSKRLTVPQIDLRIRPFDGVHNAVWRAFQCLPREPIRRWAKRRPGAIPLHSYDARIYEFNRWLNFHCDAPIGRKSVNGIMPTDP